MFDEWLNVFKQLHGALPNSVSVACPSCGKETAEWQYVGDLESRIGYLCIWCPECLEGIQLSRVKAPDSVELLSFDTPLDELEARIPNFKQIQPVSD